VTRVVGLTTAIAAWLVVARTWAQDAPPPGAPAATSPPGAVLPGVPDALPPSPLPTPTLDRVRAHLEAGDTARALDTATRLAASTKWGRERDAAWMVQGMLHREAGRHNLASEAFTQVRSAKGPLAGIAAFHEAEQDFLRGRPHTAIQECAALQKARPDTDEADDCGRIVALAHATAGEGGLARAAATAYDREHEHGPIAEQVEVRLARRWTTTQPALAVSVWKQLALHHEAPLAGRTAERELARMAAAGVPGAELPDDVGARMARALSMRDSGRLVEARALFAALRAEAATDPGIARFVAENEERFGWRTRDWDLLAERALAAYQQQKSAGVAWNRYKILVRAGRFDEAGTWALEMQKVHGRGTAFYRSEEEIGRTLMLAGRYADAVAQLDGAAKRGGWSGRRATALAAFATFVGGDAAAAITRYDAVVAADPDDAEARYWRSRALAAAGRADEARADRELVLQTEPFSWYATLFRQEDAGRPALEPYARNGTWPGQPPPPPPPIAVLDLPTTATELRPSSFFATRARPVAGDLHLSVLTWPWVRPAEPLPASSVPWERPGDPLEVPVGYRASVVHDPIAARERLRVFADANAAAFPDLAAISDLASAGLHEESGTRFSVFYRELRQQASRGNRAARKLLDGGGDAWRTFFLATHDHHDTARSLYDTWSEATDPVVATELERLGFPIAYGRYVWSHSRGHGVDPMLVLGLMRQESTYNARAVSRAGARGPMQIMPRTGHLLADLAGDELFNAGELSDPELATEYGIWYLGLLLERFEGVYPLAVASYNGGPHNLSSWLEGPAKDLPMDQLVEHIPFRETRDYVKKVSEGYAAYVSLYAPPGSVVVVPPRVTGDHPEVVDF
jgi:soluble lytic murein transglycosylase